MNWRGLVLAALIALAGCAGFEAAESQPPGTDELERQLLVMIQTAPPHYRPGAPFAQSYGSRAARPRLDPVGHALARDHGVRLVDDWPMPALGLHCFVMEAAPEQSPAALAERIAADARVESVQRMQLFQTVGRGDPGAPLPASALALELDRLHQIATGRNVRVAQADTGVDLAHPELRGRLARARNFVAGTRYAAEVHGTAVAGVIAARADHRTGAVGVAPEATLLPLRACWPDPRDADTAFCSSFALARAIQFAVDERVGVLNLSLAGPRDRLLERLIERAAESGMAVVAAVDPSAPERSFPASHPRVVAVAVDDDAGLPGNAILAPGHEVLTTVPNGGWRLFSGASFAAAHVTGVAALLLERKPGLHGDELRAVLTRRAERAPAASGATRLDACATLREVAGGCGCAAASDQPVRGQRSPRAC